MSSVLPYSSISKESGLVYFFINFMGIRIFEEQKRSITKYLWKIFPLLLLFMLVFFIIVCIRNMMKNYTEILTNISFICIGVISMALWFNVNKKKKTLKNIIVQFQRFAFLSGRKSRNANCAINTFFAIVIAIIILSVNGHVSYLQETANNRDYLTFLLIIENSSMKHLVRLFYCSFMFIISSFIPTLFTILCSSVYFKCSDVISDFCEDISIIQFGILRREEIVIMLQKYRLLHRITCRVENGLSSISFLILCSQMLSMYVALAFFMNSSGKMPTASVIWVTIPSLTVIPLSVIIFTLSASRIGAKIKEVQFTLQSIHNIWISRDKIDLQSLEIVKSMMGISFPTISAYGIVELKPGLILSVFGSLFTYGLLVQNIVPKHKEIC